MVTPTQTTATAFQSARSKVLAILALSSLIVFAMLRFVNQPDAPKQNDLTATMSRIEKATSLTIFEGLPHQRWEPDTLAKELEEKKTFKIDEYPFYETPVAASEATIKELMALCRSRKTFQPFGGPKACGGFHPDWCLELNNGTSACHILICFGCKEARLYSSCLLYTSPSPRD